MPAPDRPEGWVVVVPLKGGARAKSRLSADPALALAFARDCLDAVRSCERVRRSVVVTADPATAAWAAADWHDVVAERVPGAGLNAAVRDGAIGVEGPVAALLGDLPALRPQDLALALDAARAVLRGAAQAFVPDAAGTGTVLLAVADAGTLDPAFGAGSAAAHERRGAVRMELALPRLRQDVDDVADLRRAEQLGCGPHTLAALAAARDLPAAGA